MTQQPLQRQCLRQRWRRWALRTWNLRNSWHWSHMREIMQLLWESTGESSCINLKEPWTFIYKKFKKMSCTIMWPLVWTAAYLDLNCNWVTSTSSSLKCFLCSSVLQSNLLYLFLQTTTQAEEMRVLSFFITSHPPLLLK